ncbi:MAG: outer membrane beta-barrel protein [Alphaproteobacteria bacterium]|nr:outer membrane beta-barrel protein [Alphaproteobacteria bacterium]
MSKRITAAIVATLSVSVPAMAADIYVPSADPAPLVSGVPVYDWSGLYFGLGAGTALSNNQVTTGTVTNSFGGIGGRGYFGELTAGYDYALANGIVVGGSVNGRWGDIDANWSGVASWSGQITAEYGIDVVGRVGYALTPRTLAYALAGYSWQHFKLTGTTPAVSTNWNENGYIVGFGTESAIHDNWTLSSEYRYANYGGQSIAAYGGSIDPVIHSFHTRLNYRLNGGPSGQTAAPVIYDWNGLKVGGALGLGVALNEVTGTVGFDSMSNEAFIAEANVGYDRVFGGHWLGGVVLAARYDGGRSALVYGGTGAVAKTESAGFDALVRAGRIFGDRTLGYVIGGYSWQKMTGTIGAASNNTGVNGFTIGTGLEFAVSEKLTAYVETRYTGYEDYTVGAFNVDPSSHSVRVGAKWKLY